MFDPPVPGARLHLRQIGSHKCDDILEVWEAPDGGILLVVIGERPRTVALRADDAITIEAREESRGMDTSVTLVREGEGELLATGTVTLTTDGIHGPALARRLMPLAGKLGFAVRLLTRSRSE